MKILNFVSNPPSYISYHNDVVNAKKSPTVQAALNAISFQVNARYVLFQNELAHRNLHGIPQDPVMIANKDDLQSCYKSKTKKTLAIFEKIEKSQAEGVLSKCPYCGITRPRTFDHYLPENNYPEYSVHAVNLVPCCSECNSIKGDRVVVNSQRQFLHFYSDVLPQSQFLYVQVTVHPNRVAFGVSFSLSQPVGFDNADWQLIKNHFRKLNLLDRYQTESSDEISACFSASKSYVVNGGTNIRNFINGICDDEESKLGSSHWRVVLKRRLAITDDFIHHVINEASSR